MIEFDEIPTFDNYALDEDGYGLGDGDEYGNGQSTNERMFNIDTWIEVRNLTGHIKIGNGTSTG